MERRNFIAALAALPALGLIAACGSEGGGALPTSDTSEEVPAGADEEPPPATASPATAPVTDAESNEPVLSYTLPGGFTTREFAFQNPPVSLLTADGTLITAPKTPGALPGPIVPQHGERAVTPAGIESMISAAEDAGLLAEVDYSSEEALLIADAPTTLLEIRVGDTTYVHEASALGMSGGPGSDATESTPERQALLDFVSALDADPGSIFGAANLGEPSDYEPDAYQLSAVIEPGDLEVDTVIETWPESTGVDLATAAECVEVSKEVVGDLFDDAAQFTYFEQGSEQIYSVFVRPAYPGRTC